MKHTKKLLPEFFQQILDGHKHYELRLADWKCSEGDILVLKEWDPSKEAFTGRVLEKTISKVVKTKDVKFWSPEQVEEHGFQILSFR